MKLRKLSLLWKIWLSTSVALTGLFAVAGWILQRHALQTTLISAQEEVQASFQAYDSLWKARAEMLKSVTAILSSMPNVRAAFGTRDPNTIRDFTGELWAKISDDLRETAFFAVADPHGRVIASLGVEQASGARAEWPVVKSVQSKFPSQISGFVVHDDTLYQLVLTPVYVDSAQGPALITVLVAGFAVNHPVAQRLKDSTGGSDFLFLSRGRVYASTLNDRASGVLALQLNQDRLDQDQPDQDQEYSLIGDDVSEYAPMQRALIDLHGAPIGKLCILRSFDNARQRVSALRRDLILMWLAAISAGLLLTYLLVRRIVKPVAKLDLAASEVARQNYDYRVSIDSEDELGRLATTFNQMCASLQSAREELIRQERISTIGRLAGSIVHDLRNPLAAVYGGAEMLVDTDLTPQQTRRLAANIYRASKRIHDLLQDLARVSRGKGERAEPCSLREVIDDALNDLRPAAESQCVELAAEVPEDLVLTIERGRIGRVFYNLVSNALEVMPRGGRIRISARTENNSAVVEVSDTGPGISGEIRAQLFQPFVSFGKKNGLGLGLALSRQTVLDHGGDMWAAEPEGEGARFCVRLPVERKPAPVAS